MNQSTQPGRATPLESVLVSGTKWYDIWVLVIHLFIYLRQLA